MVRVVRRYWVAPEDTMEDEVDTQVWGPWGWRGFWGGGPFWGPFWGPWI